MNTFHDFESWGQVDWNRHRAENMLLTEAYSGTAIVGWYGKIERQLMRLLADAEKSRNFTFSEKIRGYLTVWRQNQLTGSINVEDLNPLEAAADMLARDTWTLGSYFGSLRDNLRMLKASEEELPRGQDMGNEPLTGGGAIGGGGPPMSPSFGPEGGPGGEGGEGGGPGMDGGTGGGPGGPEQGAPGDLPSPEELMGEPGAEGAPGGPEEGAPGGPEGEGPRPEEVDDELVTA